MSEIRHLETASGLRSSIFHTLLKAENWVIFFSVIKMSRAVRLDHWFLGYIYNIYILYIWYIYTWTNDRYYRAYKLPGNAIIWSLIRKLKKIYAAVDLIMETCSLEDPRICKCLVTMVSKSPRPGVVGPLTNGLFMAYKWWCFPNSWI